MKTSRSEGICFQISGSTHFLDGSLIYGSSESSANLLRTFRSGLLRVQLTPDQRPFLLNTDKPTSRCNVPSDTDICYVAGKLLFVQSSVIKSASTALGLVPGSAVIMGLLRYGRR